MQEEECYCGHLKSEHNNTKLNEGHGSCANDYCMCEQFTWKRFVDKDEAEHRR